MHLNSLESGRILNQLIGCYPWVKLIQTGRGGSCQCDDKVALNFFCRASKNKEVCHATAGESPAINFSLHQKGRREEVAKFGNDWHVVSRGHVDQNPRAVFLTLIVVGLTHPRDRSTNSAIVDKLPSFKTNGTGLSFGAIFRASHHLWCGAIFMGGMVAE